jgi:hypothetical protein
MKTAIPFLFTARLRTRLIEHFAAAALRNIATAATGRFRGD